MNSKSDLGNDFNVNFKLKGRNGYFTFHYESIKLWNKLPDELKKLNSLNKFKLELKKYLLSKQIS